MPSPDCFPLPAVCSLHKSCIWRLKYRETLLIQLLDQSLGRQSPSLLPTMSPIHSVTEDTPLCKDPVHSERLQKGQRMACFFYMSSAPHLETEFAFSHPKICYSFDQRHTSLTENANFCPHPVANTEVALKLNIAHTSNKRIGQILPLLRWWSVVQLVKSKNVSVTGISCLQKSTTTKGSAASWLEAAHPGLLGVFELLCCTSRASTKIQLLSQLQSVCVRGKLLSPAARRKAWCILRS